MKKYGFYEIGIYKQNVASTLKMAEDAFNVSCNMCYHKHKCMFNTKYGQAFYERCPIYIAHEKAIKRIITTETVSVINIYATNVTIYNKQERK